MAGVYEAYAGVTYERIDKVGLQYPVPTMDHPGTPTLFKETFPSGRGKFHPLDYYVPMKEMPDDECLFILTTGRLLENWH
jgi:predicted molibdopterin-dependent oxidoreductase YjgC